MNTRLWSNIPYAKATDWLIPKTARVNTQIYSNMPILPGTEGIEIPACNTTRTSRDAVRGRWMPNASRANWLLSKAVAQDIANQMMTKTSPLALRKTSRLVIPERNQVMVLDKFTEGNRCANDLRNES